MKKFLKHWQIKIGIAFLLLIILISFFDVALAVGLLLLVFLSAITFLILLKAGFKDQKIYLLFAITLLVHLSATLFISPAGFNLEPFGGGCDWDLYEKDSLELAHRFSKGNFSLAGTYSDHYFSRIIAVIYVFTLPKTIIGLCFITFLAAFSVLLAYLVMLEIGSSKGAAFAIGLIVAVYPSYLYFGSVLLKDTMVIPLVLIGMLSAVKILKKFSGLGFLILFAALTGAIHFRFYIGFALLLAFLVSWFFISDLKLKERVTFGFTIIFLLGFSCQIAGYGYYGEKMFLNYLNERAIKNFREVIYAPSSVKPTAEPTVAVSMLQQNSATPLAPAKPTVKPIAVEDKGAGVGSSFFLEVGWGRPVKFVTNYFLSFVFSLFGPFPWQIKNARQALLLAEVIPWHFFFFIIIYGVYKSIKTEGFMCFLKNYKYALPIALFCIMAIGAFSLYFTNFGIIARIRIPVFILLLCVMALSLNYIELKIKRIKLPMWKNT